jgi:hypothetical protein
MKQGTNIECKSDFDCPPEKAPPCHKQKQGKCIGISPKTCLYESDHLPDGTPCKEGLCRYGECNKTHCYIDGKWYKDGEPKIEKHGLGLRRITCDRCNVKESQTSWTKAPDGAICQPKKIIRCAPNCCTFIILLGIILSRSKKT